MQSIHSICGQSVELVLKASIASRTLDNITAVLVSFKNFRKTIKKEFNGTKINGNENDDLKYRMTTINQVLTLPNMDINYKDIERAQTSASSILEPNRPASNIIGGSISVHG